ncbi:MAG: acetyl-CoA carboxylase biotin carboxyl carrier protein subunit [Chloroflexi bacterium]|nr:acetyl-CoA carboxylase biotin carboxyl carrier protein subunit [Chloroflexota bacterium]
MDADLQNALAIAILGLSLTAAAGLFLWGLMALLLEYSGDAKKVAESQRQRSELQMAAEEAGSEGLPSTAAGEHRAAGLPRAQLVLAPASGVILSVAVSPDDEVAFGQELCILEIAKVKNAVRAARIGRIGSVKVAPGDAVKQGQVLMEYSG